jgi:hypothetical protein
LCGALNQAHIFKEQAWKSVEITISFLLSSSLPGELDMPSTVTPYLIGVWFCVGFFTGAGWAVAAWLVGRILSYIHV